MRARDPSRNLTFEEFFEIDYGADYRDACLFFEFKGAIEKGRKAYSRFSQDNPGLFKKIEEEEIAAQIKKLGVTLGS